MHLRCTACQDSNFALTIMDIHLHLLGKPKMNLSNQSRDTSRRHAVPRLMRSVPRSVARDSRPVAAFRQRGWQPDLKREDFSAPETWHASQERAQPRYVVQPAGAGFLHAVTADEGR